VRICFVFPKAAPKCSSISSRSCKFKASLNLSNSACRKITSFLNIYTQAPIFYDQIRRNNLDCFDARLGSIAKIFTCFRNIFTFLHVLNGEIFVLFTFAMFLRALYISLFLFFKSSWSSFNFLRSASDIAWAEIYEFVKFVNYNQNTQKQAKSDAVYEFVKFVN